ncbi:hypothetical protein K438DRAFT_1821977 [Mycena galopus ATCC 62051]|nr:hypothetical protein K438DRAFT_1821977 [Mycena galopus ATCC 62051]
MALLVYNLTGPFQPGEKMTLQWVSNVNQDPSMFNLELFSPTFNSLTVIAQNVDIFANQLAIEFPVSPPSDDYIFWLVDLTNKTNVYTNSNSFSITTAKDQTTAPTSNVPPPMTSPVASPVHSTSAVHPNTTAEDRPSTTPAFTTTPPEIQSASGASRKSMSGRSIAGIAIAAVFLLALGVMVWLCVRRSHCKPRLNLQPQEYLHAGEDQQESHQRSFSGEKLRAMPQSRLSEAEGGGDLELLLRQNKALAARIGALESDVHSLRMESEWLQESPPGYLD